MEFNRRAVDERPRSSDHHPPLRYDYCTVEAPRGGFPYGGTRRDNVYIELKPSDTSGEVLNREYKERIRDAPDAGRRSLEDELRRDLNMKKELILRERRVDEVGRFRGGMPMRVEDRGMPLNEERALEERIARTVEDRIAVSLESRIVTAFERSGIVERIARTVEDNIVSSLEGRIVMALERSGMMETIARTAEDRIGITLEGRIASLEKFGAAAMKGIGKQRLVHSGPVGVEHRVTEVVQPPGHVVKEAKSRAIHGNTNAPSGQGVKKVASTDVAKNTGKEVWSCSLCNIRATSKRGLDEHLRGKKHKLVEAGSMPETKRKNPPDNVLPPKKKKKAANPPDNVLPPKEEASPPDNVLPPKEEAN